jgi:hypothetical protein
MALDVHPPPLSLPPEHPTVPNPSREQAEYLHGKIAEHLQTVKLLEEQLRQQPERDSPEHARADLLAAAITHLTAALEALEHASQK